MVVHTRTDQVKHAQSAVVEFLLVNHPLDCPVCDKGGECPLQDITQGWGPGKSRFTDEKRHFEKPVELSPQNAFVRKLQHRAAEAANLVSRSRGREPFRRVRVYPEKTRAWR